MKIGVKTTFDCAHKLRGEEFGKCCENHGHTYRLSVEIEGAIEPNGVVMNYTELKRMVKDAADFYDHKDLCKFFEQPTAENILREIAGSLKKELPTRVKLSEIILQETDNTFCKLSKADLYESERDILFNARGGDDDRSSGSICEVAGVQPEL